MKPAPFAYTAPDSLATALGVLAEHGWDAKLLAGGQSLVPLLNFRLAQPELLVDLNGLQELDFIREEADGTLHIGAMTRQARLERDQLVAARAPLLHEAVPFVAHPQIRNRGTLGGTLAHADPAAELPVIALALEARLRIQRRGNDRWVAAQDFFVGLLTTDLAPEEMLIEVAIPPMAPGTGWAFEEVARRHGDYAHVGVAVLLTLGTDGRCTAARLVFLSVCDVPMVAQRAAACLIGEAPSAEAFAAAAHTASEEIEPCDDIHASAAFKRHLAEVLTKRALGRALARARGGGGTHG